MYFGWEVGQICPTPSLSDYACDVYENWYGFSVLTFSSEYYRYYSKYVEKTLISVDEKAQLSQLLSIFGHLLKLVA